MIKWLGMGNAGKKKNMTFFIKQEMVCCLCQRTWGIVQQGTEIARLVRLQLQSFLNSFCFFLGECGRAFGDHHHVGLVGGAAEFAQVARRQGEVGGVGGSEIGEQYL